MHAIEVRCVSGLGNNVRAFRIAAGLSQAKLARLVGCDPSAISRVERSEIAPRDALKLRIAEALGVSVWRLFFQQDDARCARIMHGTEVSQEVR